MTLRALVRAAACAVSISSAAAIAISAQQLQYPAARKVAQADDYHGTKVADPYRWLEDDNSADTAA